MELKLDLSKEYGIVLEGGGAKGAYQVGAWKALKEAGIRIRGIAGSSVGALNGALMCMDDLKKAEEVWKNMEYSRVMEVSDDTMKALKGKDFRALNIQEVLSGGFQFIKDGGFNVAPLKELISEVVGDEARIRESPREFYAMTYSVTDHKGLAVDVRSGKEGSVKDMLLASAYFLAFKNEKLGGKRYRDGGGFNNVPLNVLVDRGYENVIVIRIYGWGFDRERVTRIPEGTTVYHIAPRQDLGGILDFDGKQCRKNMKLGYYDAKRFLYGLSGRIYYIDAPWGEPYYFDKMMSELELLKLYTGAMKESGRPDSETSLSKPPVLELPILALSDLGLSGLRLSDLGLTSLELSQGQGGYREYTEKLFPEIASRLKLKEDWDYKDLYLSVLEDMAKRLKINRFRIYTVDDLLGKIRIKLHSLDSGNSI